MILIPEDRSVFDLIAPKPDSVLRYGDLPDQCIDLYSTDESDTPIIILIHGGYWRSEYDRIHLRPLAATLAETGWQVALIEYRRITGDPDAMVSDIKKAIEFISAIDSKKSIILMGHSAGGHLALWAASVISNLKSIIALAPIADLTTGEKLNLDSGAIREFLGKSASLRTDLDPILITTGAIPITIIHGDADLHVPIELSRGYVKSKKLKGEIVNLIELAQIGHFELIDPRSSVWPIILETLANVEN